MIDAALREMVREAVRDVVRDELRLALRDVVPRPAATGEDDAISPARAAEITGFRAETIRERIRSGDIVAFKPPGSREYRIRRSELQRWLQAARNGERSSSQEEIKHSAREVLAALQRG